MKDLEKINFIRLQLKIGLIEAKELINKFNDVDLAINYWKKQIEEKQKKIQNQKYDSFNKLYFFEDEYCIPILEDNDKSKIRVLSNNYCSELWNKYVTEKPNHLMLINDTKNWKIENEISKDYNWENDWNENNVIAFENNIKPLIDYKEEDKIIYFWSKYSGVETEWRIICKYWIAFLYEDESNIIINPNNTKVMILATNGNVSIGKRK